MENRVERAVTNHNRGYNCAQSVVCAYCELFGMDESAAFRLAEGFGGGMGGMQDGTCGAVAAMYMPCNRWIADAARIVEAQLVGDAEAQAQK